LSTYSVVHIIRLHETNSLQRSSLEVEIVVTTRPITNIAVIQNKAKIQRPKMPRKHTKAQILQD